VAGCCADASRCMDKCQGKARCRRQSDAGYEEQQDSVAGAEGVGRQVRKQMGERS
jgi:hypothetical protein